MGDEPDGPVRLLARAAAAASSTSTASSAARRTSTTRRSTRGRPPIEPDRTPEEGYHFTEDMTDKAIAWVRQQKALMADKPFFVYFAPGATHAPHHVPAEWSAKYKGKFDQGWDALREETFARQKELGVDPARRGADRAPGGDPRLGRHARRPEAGARAADGGLRRLPRAHRPPRRPARRRARGPRRSSTTRSSTTSSATTARAPRGRSTAASTSCVILNGADALRDDRVHGLADRRVRHARRPTTTTPSAGRTRWTRRTSGRSRSPRTGAAPATARSSTGRRASRRKGEVRSQFHHVIDVAPTVLEAAGLPEPKHRARRRSRSRSRA